MNRRMVERITGDRRVWCPECNRFIGLIRGGEYPEPERECCRAFLEEVREQRRALIRKSEVKDKERRLFDGPTKGGEA